MRYPAQPRGRLDAAGAAMVAAAVSKTAVITEVWARFAPPAPDFDLESCQSRARRSDPDDGLTATDAANCCQRGNR